MKRTVYKYNLESHGLTELEMPTDAIPLKLGEQNGIVMWVEVMDPDEAPVRLRKFLSVFTGETISLNNRRIEYIDTIQRVNMTDSAAFMPFIVVHVYEVFE